MERAIFCFAMLLSLPAWAQTPGPDSADSADEIEANIARTPFARRVSAQEEQIQCKPADCVQVYFPGNSEEMEARLSPLFDQKAGKILVQFKIEQPKLTGESMDSIRAYIREIAKRGGRVTVEPLYIGYRGGTFPPVPLVSDMLSVGYSLASRVYNYFAFKEMELYHAKVLIHPQTQKVVYVYFVHRSYGDRSLHDPVQRLQFHGLPGRRHVRRRSFAET